MANPNYNDLLTTTIENRSRKLADNVTKNNALLKRLNERGKIRPIDGGSKIVEELEYGEGSMIWYNGYDSITDSHPQLFSAAEFAMKLCAVPVSISGEDQLKNSGREKMLDLMQKRIENAEKTLSNNLSKALYSDGTGSSGKEIGGLKLLVADNPNTGTVGGINRATGGNEFWRNQAKIADSALTKDTIRAAMDAMFEQSLTDYQRFSDPKMADAGFTSLKYKGADVIFDGGQGGACPAKHMYFLNTDYLYLRPHKDRNFTAIGGDRMAINQDAIYQIIGWAGNLTMSNASLQGVLVNA